MAEDEEDLELEARKDIFDFISQYPGTHMRKIQRELDLSMGQLEYHLNYLEKNGLISSSKKENKRRYFVEDEVHYPDRDILSTLRLKTPRRILIQILDKDGCSFNEILEEVDISKSTLSYHLKKLQEKSLVESEKEGRKKIYRCPDREKIAHILVTYKSSFIDDAVDRFVDTWTEMMG